MKRFYFLIILFAFGLISLTTYAQPANDLKINATTLTGLDDWCSSNAAYTTYNATADEAMPSCWSGSVNNNVWFKLTAPGDYLKILLKTGGSYGSMHYGRMALTDLSGTQIGCVTHIVNQGTTILQVSGLTSGEEYYLNVDNYYGSSQWGSFTLCTSTEKDYDWKEAALDLTGEDLTNWCSADAAYSTYQKTADEPKPSCWSGSVYNNVWFKFTAPSDYLKISLKTGGSFGSMHYGRMAVTDMADNEIGCVTHIVNQGTTLLTLTGLTSGEDYYLNVDNYYGSSQWGSFTLCTSTEKDYDWKEAALDLTGEDLTNWCSADAAYSTYQKTADEPKPSCWSGSVYNNVWFKFTAPSDYLKISLKTGGSFGSMHYGRMAVTDMADNEIGCVTHIVNQGTTLLTLTGLTSGEDYYLNVDNYYGSSQWGSFTLCTSTEKDYDWKEAALDLTGEDLTNWCSADAAYSTYQKTADEPKPSCWSGSVYNNVWFKFTAPSDYLKISLKTGGSFGSMHYGRMAVTDMADNEIGCVTHIVNQGTTLLTLTGLTSGEDYYLNVDNYYGSSQWGSFTLCTSTEKDYDWKEAALDLTGENLTNWCSADAAYSTYQKTADEPKPSCWSGSVYNNVWFKFTAPSDYLKISLKTGSNFGSMHYGRMAVTDMADNEIGCVTHIVNQGTTLLTLTGLTSGEDYYLNVDNYYGSSQWGSFTLCTSTEKDYDWKEAALDLTGEDLTNWCSADAAYSTYQKTADEPKPSCWSGSVYNNVWFKFTAPSDYLKISLKTGGSFGSMHYGRMAVTDMADNEIGCVTHIVNQGTTLLTLTGLTSGEDYYLNVDNYYGSSQWGSFTLCTSTEKDYDWKEAALDLTGENLTNWCSADAAYSTYQKTADEPKPSCWSGSVYNNVWFKFTAPSDYLKISLKTGSNFGSMHYGRMAVTDMADNEIGCVTHIVNQGTTVLTLTGLTAGEDYLLNVDNYYGSSQWGSFTLCMTNIKDYDWKDHAYELTNTRAYCSSDQQFSTYWKTPDETKPSCWSNGPAGNVWFKFIATTPQIEIIGKTGGSYGNMQYMMMALWDNDDNVLECVNYSGSTSWKTISSTSLIPGETYYIEVDHRQGASFTTYWGSFSLCVDDGSFESSVLWLGGTSDDWHTASNWSGNFVPTALNPVDIPADSPNQPVVSSTGRCYSLTLFPGASITINSGSDLSVGTRVILQSNTTQMASLIDHGNLVVGGQSTMDVKYSGNGWHMVSAPIDNAVSGLYLDKYLRSYDEATGWEYIVPVNVPLNPAEGYALWSTSAGTNNVSYNGTFNTGNQSFDLSYSGPPTTGFGWNLVGNPYPSSLDWDEVSLPAGLDAAIYLWDPALGNYRYYIPGGGGLNTTSQYVPAGQAFFVHYTNATVQPLSFNNNDRAHSAQQFYKSNESQSNILRLKLSCETGSEQAGVRFINDCSADFDQNKDVYCIEGAGENTPTFYTYAQNEKYSINSMGPFGSDVTIDAGFYANNAGTYTLSVDQLESFDVDVQAFVEDPQTNTIAALDAESPYYFDYDGDLEEYKFSLILVKENAIVEAPVFVYGADDQIKIINKDLLEGSYLVFDLSGRKIAEGDFNNVSTTVEIYKDQTVYLVQYFLTNGERFVTKVFVK